MATSSTFIRDLVYQKGYAVEGRKRIKDTDNFLVTVDGDP
jgi:hypothetical protein